MKTKSQALDAQPSKKYLLIGFMGSGKSTLMKELKGRLNKIPCKDLDHLIADSYEVSPSELGLEIEKRGLADFRQRERELLEQELEREGPVILALGGGAIGQDLIDHCQKLVDCQLVWLMTPFELCWQRINNDENRPLVKEGEGAMRKLFQERAPLYAQADIHWDGTKDVNELVRLFLLPSP